jgi:hypothetical protein
MVRDLRKYARDTTIRLGVGALLLIFLIGDGLIYFIYGSGPAVMGLLCLAAGIFPILLIIGVLFTLEWIVKRANRD